MLKVPLETFRGEQVRPERNERVLLLFPRLYIVAIHRWYNLPRTYTVGAVPRNEDVSLG